MSFENVTVEIARDDGAMERYQVEYDDHLTILRILNKIYLNQDRSLAYRHFCCNLARCASCLVKVNGETVYACKHTVEPGGRVRLEAAGGGRRIRDLVIAFGAPRSAATLVRSLEI
jgi:succinate dehydrogenase/fumarate reductase-like Fe-S protein